MAIKEVLQLGNSRLREVSAEITDFDEELAQIIEDLDNTLSYLQQIQGMGRALAAPQIGYHKKVILFKTPATKLVMINPQIKHKSAEMFEVWDSCFSFNLAFFVKIKRHLSIEVSYIDENGVWQEKAFNGDLSELFQHEIDHLYGVLAIDHLGDDRQIIMRSEWLAKHGEGSLVSPGLL